MSNCNECGNVLSSAAGRCTMCTLFCTGESYGARHERAAIVAYLRAYETGWSGKHALLDEIADLLEKGEHLE